MKLSGTTHLAPALVALLGLAACSNEQESLLQNAGDESAVTGTDANVDAEVRVARVVPPFTENMPESELFPPEYIRDGTEITPLALAELEPTEGNETSGLVSFIQSENDAGVRVIAKLEDLPDGSHGFHIHETGDCSAPDASSAGGHFNPTGEPHGGRGDERRHVGDLGNIVADGHNFAALDIHDQELAFEGEASIIGKAVIVHAGQDDLESQPSGDAGQRLACGIIRMHHIDSEHVRQSEY